MLAKNGFDVTLLYTQGQKTEAADIDFWATARSRSHPHGSSPHRASQHGVSALSGAAYERRIQPRVSHTDNPLMHLPRSSLRPRRSALSRSLIRQSPTTCPIRCVLGPSVSHVPVCSAQGGGPRTGDEHAERSASGIENLIVAPHNADRLVTRAPVAAPRLPCLTGCGRGCSNRCGLTSCTLQSQRRGLMLLLLLRPDRLVNWKWCDAFAPRCPR